MIPKNSAHELNNLRKYVVEPAPPRHGVQEPGQGHQGGDEGGKNKGQVWLDDWVVADAEDLHTS